VNDATWKAGTITENRHGCSHANSYRAVPPGYLGAYVQLIHLDQSDGWRTVCSTSGTVWNTTTDESITVTTGYTTCPVGWHRGESINWRDTDSAGLKKSGADSPYAIF